MRPPVQDRSRRTLERILGAALDLIAERGVEGASVHDIVERAGSSVGSFYARFDGKDDLVRYLEERVWSTARERWDEGLAKGSWREASLPDLVRGLVDLVLRLEGGRTAWRRALQAPGAAGHGSRAGADAFRAHIARDVRALLLGRRDEIGHPDPDVAADAVLPVLVGAARERPDAGPGGPWARELARMTLAYLGSATVEAHEGDAPEVDFFDVWG